MIARVKQKGLWTSIFSKFVGKFCQKVQVGSGPEKPQLEKVQKLCASAKINSKDLFLYSKEVLGPENGRAA